MDIYEGLLEVLSPPNIMREAEEPHDNARGSFSLKRSRATSYKDFEDAVIEYTDHHMQQVYGGSLPPDMLLSKARGYLDDTIGYKNAAFLALSGQEGGLNNVLTNIADGFKSESRKAFLQHTLSQYVDRLDFNQIVSLMRVIKQRMVAYSPDSFRFVEAEAMAAEGVENILWLYINELSRHKNLWKY